jgi:predicted nuclease with TOPRIM domain
VGLFADIERLITEHGSAAILRERLALLADQAKAQEKVLADSQRRIGELEQERSQLKAELGHLRNQLDRAQPQIDSLPPESERMLVVFAGTSDGIPSDHVIRQLGFSQAQGDYYFDHLLKRKFVHASSGQMGVGWFYYATAAGREYLAQHGLL